MSTCSTAAHEFHSSPHRQSLHRSSQSLLWLPILRFVRLRVSYWHALRYYRLPSLIRLLYFSNKNPIQAIESDFVWHNNVCLSVPLEIATKIIIKKNLEDRTNTNSCLPIYPYWVVPSWIHMSIRRDILLGSAKPYQPPSLKIILKQNPFRFVWLNLP